MLLHKDRLIITTKARGKRRNCRTVSQHCCVMYDKPEIVNAWHVHVDRDLLAPPRPRMPAPTSGFITQGELRTSYPVNNAKCLPVPGNASTMNHSSSSNESKLGKAENGRNLQLQHEAGNTTDQQQGRIERDVAILEREGIRALALSSKLASSCETWTLTLREEHRLRVFENKVLRKLFGAKRDEVTGEWRKLHNTELHALYSLPDVIRNIKSRYLRWAGHVASMGESRNAFRVLVERPAGKRPLGRPRRRWEDNIKMDLREVGYDDRDWINLAQDRDQWRAYVRAAMNLRVP
ncbi:hypothetical protein ANN_18491 [Periplaneta americana]|uniref:Uncharacterized protein n=1 Tax=Periplaneta americana TaxID=6978 RepID=A0ABQ8SQ46_PERAM|nr:hypothetical protein ANN_18491 [Periplaneta americana]